MGTDMWRRWQDSWDEQQQAFMPDREERFGALLDVVEATCGTKPHVLDLAGGTGSITLRLLDRMPDATSVVQDLDPATLRIAEGTFATDERVQIVRSDLSTPDWTDGIGDFDAVLTATALHWIPEVRLRELYAEVATVVRPGGIFCNADHMADPDIPNVAEKVDELRRVRREAAYAGGIATWPGWWEAVRAAPELADAVAERDTIFTIPHRGGAQPPYTTHLEFLRAGGFSEAGLIWRGQSDAAFVAVR